MPFDTKADSSLGKAIVLITLKSVLSHSIACQTHCTTAPALNVDNAHDCMQQQNSNNTTVQYLKEDNSMFAC